MNNRIRTVRNDNSLSQEKFAARIGLTKNFISLIETGDRIPSDRTIKDICKEFNVNENWLRTGNGEKYEPQTSNQQIAAFMNEVMADVDESIRKKLITALTRLSVQDWEKVDQIAKKLLNK